MEDRRTTRAPGGPAASARRQPATFHAASIFRMSIKPSLLHRTLSCGAFILAALSAPAAITWKNIQLGGFASQGFLQSDANDYLGETSEGTFDFREYAVNASWATGKWRLGAQVFGQRLGEYGHDTIALDWASLDYQATQWFGVRAGRVKMPRGLYNEALDLDSVRPFVLMPQSVYDARLRDFNAAFDGAMIYGNVSLARGGSLDYRAFYGNKKIDTDSGANDYFNSDFAMFNGAIELDSVLGGTLFWNTPIQGLRLGYSYSEFENLKALRGFFAPGVVDVYKRTSSFPRHLYSAEYSRGDWIFAAEIGREDADYFTGLPADPTLPESPIFSRNLNYYGSVARRINPWLELGAYYSHFDKKDSMPPMFNFHKQQDDYALSARFDVNEHLLFKVELHHMKGNGKVFEAPRDIFAPPPATDDGSWTMIAVKATCSF